MGTPSMRWVAVVFVLLLAACFLGWLARAPGLAYINDDARYLLLARSLAEGHYRDLEILGTPPHAQYPPVFPAVLAVLSAAHGSVLELGIVFNLLVLGVGACLVADALRRLGFPLLGVLAAGAIALNPSLLRFGGTVVADPLYVAISAASVWLLCRHGAHSTSRLAAVMVLAVLGFLTRSIGIALIAAVVADLVPRQGWRRGFVATTLISVPLVGWFALTWYLGQDALGHTYADDIGQLIPAVSESGMFAHLLSNARYYLARIGPNQFGLPNLQGTVLDSALYALLLLGTASLGLRWLWNRWRAVVWLGGFTTLILLAYTWPVDRYFSTLVPWIVVALGVGATLVGRHFGLRRPEWLGAALLGVLVVAGLSVAVQRASLARACRSGDYATTPGCVNPETADFVRIVRFLRDSTAEHAVVVSPQPATVYFLTGRVGLPPERMVGATREMLAPTGPVDMVILSTISSDHGTFGALWEDCEALEAIGPDGLLGTIIRPRTGPVDACDRLERLWARYQEDAPEP